VIFIEFLKEKKDATKQLKIVVKKNQLRQKLKALKSDNGGKLVRTDLKECLTEKGIKQKLNPRRTSQWNGGTCESLYNREDHKNHNIRL